MMSEVKFSDGCSTVCFDLSMRCMSLVFSLVIRGKFIYIMHGHRHEGNFTLKMLMTRLTNLSKSLRALNFQFLTCDGVHAVC
jgi:hypothetical protein